jgi:uncharacterized delta-60 repeat protein
MSSIHRASPYVFVLAALAGACSGAPGSQDAEGAGKATLPSPKGDLTTENLPGGGSCSQACTFTYVCIPIGPRIEKCFASCACPSGTTVTVVGPYGGDADASALVGTSGDFVVGGSSVADVDGNLQIGLVKYHSNGEVDTTFGSGGRVHTAITQQDRLRGLAGLATPASNAVSIVGVGYGSQPVVATYQASGALVNGFPTGQFVGGNSDEGFLAVALDPPVNPTGFVAVGFSGSFGGSLDHQWILARFTMDGGLDPTFGTSGKVAVALPWGSVMGDAYASAVAIQPDGKIVVAGNVGSPDPNEAWVHNYAVARFNANGSLDTSFGQGGFAQANFASLADDEANAVQLDRSWNPPRIVVAGSHYDIWTGTSFAGVVRYTADGALDSTFGSGGLSWTNVGVSQSATSLSIVGIFFVLPGGGVRWISTQYVMGGYTDASSFIASSITSAGNVDTAFGATGPGYTVIPFGSSAPFSMSTAMLEDSQGGFVLSGIVGTNQDDYGVARVEFNGTPDTSFGQ